MSVWVLVAPLMQRVTGMVFVWSPPFLGYISAEDRSIGQYRPGTGASGSNRLAWTEE